MSDFFGYNRPAPSTGTLVTSEYATLTLSGGAGGGGGNVALTQQVSAQYGQQVVPHFECGSSNLFWQVGHPSGQIQMSRLVGMTGFAAAWGALRTCGGSGSLVGVTLALTGTGSCSSATPSGKALSFAGGICTTVSWGWSAQGLDVTESASILISELSDQ